MAFAGISVEFGYAGARGVKTGVDGRSAQSLFRLVSSENVTTAGTTTATAPSVTEFGGEPIARIYALSDSWVAFGTTPNASANPRAFIPAGETRDYVVKAGEKVAWVAA